MLVGASGAGCGSADRLGRAQVVVQDRRVRLPSPLRTSMHRRQHLVLDLDQVEGVLGDVRVGRGDGGDGVAVEQRLVDRR